MPYVKNGMDKNGRGSSGTWTCPSRSRFPSASAESRGYGCNGNLMGWGDVNNPGKAASKSLAEITDPAGTFVVAEGSQLTSAAATPGSAENLNPDLWFQNEQQRSDWQVVPPGGWSNNNTANYLSKDSSCNQCRRPIPRHSGGMNVVYSDGHAKWSKWQQFLGISAANPKGWPYGDPRNSWDNR